MPVPFEGPTGLTKGQATRDFAELQFEKETAKLAEIGEPLRERVQAQSARFIDNFDALIDLSVPIEREVRGIGLAVDKAVTNKAEIQRKKIQKLYQQADDLGDTAELVEMRPLVGAIEDLARFEGVAANVKPIRQEAIRLGAVALDEDGILVAQQMSIKDAELLRQFVNQATDWTDKRQALMARKINSAVDNSTEGLGGAIYKKARKERQRYANEFENVGLTAKLLANKGKTSERAIAFEDVFNKIIILSPVEEMNKMRRTLLKAGPDGKQAWADLKAQGIAYIKDKSLSLSQRDAAGNPALSPDKLQKVIKTLDDDGKLESLYGKKISQKLRDLAELATEIYTAPQGAVNYSNTASAITNAVDTVLTYGISGMPIAGRAVLKESLDYIKNRKLKARIREALKEPTE
jgi:ribosome-associated translation inhibitor RaiA